MSLRVINQLGRKDRAIAIIDGGEEDGSYLVVDEKPGTEAIILPDTSKFRLLYDQRKNTAQHIHIVGPSGCGKSTVSQEIVSEFPGKVIVVSADQDQDPALKDINARIKADEFMHEIDIDTLKKKDGVFVIFDDIEGVPKPVADSLNIFKRALHERGRKYGIRTINVYHRGADGQSTRSSLGEMTHLVIFPHFANNQNTRYLLSKYAGLPDNFCDLVKDPIWGRRVYIGVNDVPQFIIGERAAAIINHSTIQALSKYYRKEEAKRISASV